MNEDKPVDGKLILITLESWADIQNDTLNELAAGGINTSGEQVLKSFARMMTHLNQTYLGRDRAYDPCWERLER